MLEKKIKFELNGMKITITKDYFTMKRYTLSGTSLQVIGMKNITLRKDNHIERLSLQYENGMWVIREYETTISLFNSDTHYWYNKQIDFGFKNYITTFVSIDNSIIERKHYRRIKI